MLINTVEIQQSFSSSGWPIDDKSSQDLLIGHCGNLWVLAYEPFTGTENPVFILIDRERLWWSWVRVIPSPRIASVLLEEHGEILAEESLERSLIALL